MKNSISILFILISFLNSALCQQTAPVNQTDSNGRKQGLWIKKYPNGVAMYEGTFRDGHPVGEMKRFYENSGIKAVLIYSEDGRQADAKIYFPNGYIAAKGKYIDQMKEGKWQYFSSLENEYMISEEEYINNIKNGLSVKLYPEKTVAEKFTYINGIKEGEWLQFYPDGKPLLKSYFLNGKVNGKFEVWTPTGQIRFSGSYREDARDGLWLIYNEDGTIKYRLNYVNGVTKDKQMDIDQSDFLDSLEKNKGKIPDPEITGEILK